MDGRDNKSGHDTLVSPRALSARCLQIVRLYQSSHWYEGRRGFRAVIHAFDQTDVHTRVSTLDK